MEIYMVIVTDEVDATWIFRCSADSPEHAKEQALDEGTVVKVCAMFNRETALAFFGQSSYVGRSPVT